MSILDISRSLEHDAYLGLPLMIGRSRTKDFRYIKDRLWSRIQNWNRKLLSQASRGIMIQSVLQAIPIYVMSYFKLPKGFIHELNMLAAEFWWVILDKEEEFIGNRIHYVVQSLMEDLVSKIWKALIWHYWLNNGGELYKMQIRYVTRYSRQDTFMMFNQ